VLVSGESGTGKELVARAIHRNSHRSDKPFVVVDCCTLVGTLFESELFGHVKGSFTGATASTHGRIELANGGTLFIDEIGNISTDTQAKLLRVIQEREFTRVGCNQTVHVDIRIVAATNKNLLRGIQDGSFREDLYYRLSVVPIVAPPLRHHLEDIPVLADFFLCRYARERKKNVKAISPAATDVLFKNEWPGNVRELENAIERAVILAESDVIQPSDLLQYDYHVTHGEKNGAQADSVDDFTLAGVEKRHIEQVLGRVGGNRGLAARQLGIDRKTLWRKVNKYNISPAHR
jgi:transcriptional regulator with PAS, ATPase and Fis domain